MTPDEARQGAHAMRWYLFSKPGALIPLNPDSAIFKFYVDNPYLITPLGPEITADDGSVYQSFWGGAVTWDAQNGARVLR